MDAVVQSLHYYKVNLNDIANDKGNKKFKNYAHLTQLLNFLP